MKYLKTLESFSDIKTDDIIEQISNNTYEGESVYWKIATFEPKFTYILLKKLKLDKGVRGHNIDAFYEPQTEHQYQMYIGYNQKDKKWEWSVVNFPFENGNFTYLGWLDATETELDADKYNL